ncbi:Beta-glucuronidase [Tolypocladium ophioglossoides CBS 100239]|uniref:Beta-glucuronidase n=1 Tax=Tolypocladium ophioglossoides (strain CBS 100239) TaxID=1163406 RepID=A0A0L0MZD9_TOLOC|nr:Beta-glucuronidase [Tolypocladium ophioglossoides CBS 100239]
MHFLLAALWSGLILLHSLATAHSPPNTKRSPVPYKVQTPPLDTDWTYKVGTNPWPEHPRPQLRRDVWQSLNGIWTYQAAASTAAVSSPPSGPLDREVMIPSCIESALSGIQELNGTNMWFARSFQVPKSWDGNTTLLNFEAVDYEATVFVNGVNAGNNVGGYFRFSIDVTKLVKYGQDNQLLVFVYDPTDLDVIPVGKQTKNPRHIWYGPCSGIWQTVWMESVASNYVTQLDVSAGMDGTVALTAHSSQNKGAPVKLSILDADGHEVATQSGTSDKELKVKMGSPKLWSPSSPNLYNITVTMGDDEVHSYTGFRTISTGIVKGVQRPLLNGEFIFIFGTLDQGFWPDGLYSPPSREAMIYDLKMLKSLGFNMLRKHIKVESDLFYQACDEIGLMVFQDMPSLPADDIPNAAQQQEFQRQLEILINEHKSYPSIVTWIIYNEGWGQLLGPPYPEAQLTEVVRNIDPTRLIDSTTGWFDHGFGDFSKLTGRHQDNHHYANPQCGTPFYSIPSSPHDPKRIGFQGEFGGIGNNVSADHLWKVQQAIDTINQTYELNDDLDAYNYRAGILFREFREQIERYACSGGIWTQTTDVEGEVNGLYTYDRRVLRPDVKQWKDDIQSLYQAARARA